MYTESVNGLWQYLRDQLRVQVLVEVHEDAQSQTPVVVGFLITNVADPPSQEHPEILFERLVLKVGVPPNWHIQELGALSSGQSVTYDHACSYSDLPEIEYSLEGSVSTEAYFSVRQQANKLSSDSVALTVQAYVEVFQEIPIHGWLNSTLKSLPIPNSNTTLKDIETLQSSLSDAIAGIQGAQARLDRLARLIRKQDQEAVSRHRKIVESYLQSTSQSISKIQQNLRLTDTKQVSSTLADVIGRLENQAIDVDRATEDLAGQGAPR